MLNKPELILADEPTCNLDSVTSEEILDLFNTLSQQGKTVMIVTHNYAAIAKKPARTLVCSNGMVSDSAANDVIIDFESLLDRN